MKKIPNTSTWKLEYTLPFKGVYTYKLVVDETDWIPDPESVNIEPDGMGGYNTRLNIYLDKEK